MLKSTAIIWAVSVFVGISAQAEKSLSTYNGNFYANKDAQSCQAAYVRVAARATAAGLEVVSGGCLAVPGAGYRIQFSYMHEFTQRIEQFAVSKSSFGECAALVSSAVTDLQGAGQGVIDGYCRGSQLQVDYVKAVRTSLFEMSLGASFASEAQCQDFLTATAEDVVGAEITPVLFHCSAYHLGGVQNFRASGHYVAPLGKVLRRIRGNEVVAGQSCLADLAQKSDRFNQAGYPLATAYCAPEYGGKIYEVIHYVSGLSMGLNEFAGLVYVERAVCETELAVVTERLQAAGKQALYGYCRQRSDGHQIVVHYKNN